MWLTLTRNGIANFGNNGIAYLGTDTVEAGHVTTLSSTLFRPVPRNF